MSRLDDLQVLRGVLIESIAMSDPEKRAPLAAQLRATLKEISELEADTPAEGGGLSPADEVRARREARARQA